MAQMCSAAARMTGTGICLLILSDYQTKSFWSKHPLHPETMEQLFDLAHILKEVDQEFGLQFSEERFFKNSGNWTELKNFKYFNYAEIRDENSQSLAWLCILDEKRRNCHLKDAEFLESLGCMLHKELLLVNQLRISEQIQNNLIHVVAHDLRNPLAGIMGISDHIPALHENPKDLCEIKEMIQHSARRMLHMLEEILKSGFLESGKIQLKVSPSSFHNLLLQAIRNHQKDAERKSQYFHLELDETENLSMLDYTRMMEVLDNLLSNSVKYAPKGSEIEVKTMFFPEIGMIEFSLYNQGTGLSEEDKGKIFQKFTRLSARPTGGESSTGLGLSIARTLTEMHGGTIRAESDGLECGVRFILQLPASRVA